MATITNMCPNCKSMDIEKERYGKYTGAGCLLIIIGLISLPFYGLGLLFIIPAIVMGAISGTKYRCNSCKAQWE